MSKKAKSCMRWEDAPDTISPLELAKILGIGIIAARNIFDQPDFPKISKSVIGNIGKADKEVARLYIQGFKIKEKSRETLEFLMLQELKKLTNMSENNILKEKTLEV